MEIARISFALIVSRLGEMVASLFYFSFIGHFIVDSLSQASLAWALVSFLTVIGIGFFSILLVNVAGSTDLNANVVALDLNVSFRYAILFGCGIVFGVLFYVISVSGSPSMNDNNLGLEVLLVFSFSIPAIYVQIVVFNFFNAIKKTKYEVLYAWMFNLALVVMGSVLVLLDVYSNVIYFVFAYVALRWFFAVAALFFFSRTIHLYIFRFRYLQSVEKRTYANYFFKGLPLALCFGGESLLFFILSFVSKSLGDASLSAYQASLHFLSVLYMISIGVGNATGIITARHYQLKEYSLLKQTYFQGMVFGFVMLIPFLLACFFLKENISLLYTSDEVVRRLIESNIIISIPFLVFEYAYIVTRMTLRSVGDFWVPALFTIVSLNILGLIISTSLLSFFEYSVRSIFVALVFCSFVLMLFLLQRLGRIFKEHDCRVLGGES
jgi:MATE family multidrug resistance protein